VIVQAIESLQTATKDAGRRPLRDLDQSLRGAAPRLEHHLFSAIDPGGRSRPLLEGPDCPALGLAHDSLSETPRKSFLAAKSPTPRSVVHQTAILPTTSRLESGRPRSRELPNESVCIGSHGKHGAKLGVKARTWAASKGTRGCRCPATPRRRWSGRPESNRRRPAWEAGILPLNYARVWLGF
jgi:hypothetical protein